MSKNLESSPECWYVLVAGLPLVDDEYDLGEGLIIRRLLNPLTVFDLASVGSVGFREWATLEPMAGIATAEIISPTNEAEAFGYDALNKCWLASAIFLLRGYVKHLCPAVSRYSWNLIAGHQKSSSSIFKKQMTEEGIHNAVYNPRGSLPPFQGGLLDYHLKLFIPKQDKDNRLDFTEAKWIADNFSKFHNLASSDDRFRFALESVVDWRYSKEPRAAIARLWSGIESLFGIKSELVYRISLSISTIMVPRGPARIEAFKRAKKLYGLRSKAVHGSSIDYEKLIDGVIESFQILCHLLIDIIERGSVRSEEDHLSELLV